MRELVDRIESLRRQLARSVVVGISGVDCAGKSTLAARLREELPPPVLVLHGDELTRPPAEREDYLESFDYSQVLREVIPAARANERRAVEVRVTDWERGGWRSERIALEPGTAVIVEGCFLFTADSDGAFDLAVWLDLPLDRVVERALARPRDLERMGGADGVRRRYAERYLPGQRRHLERDRPVARADVVLPSAGFEVSSPSDAGSSMRPDIEP